MGGTGLEPVASCVSSIQPPLPKDSNHKDLANCRKDQCNKSCTLAKENSPQLPEVSADLGEIVEAWSILPEHVRQAIVTLVASVTVTAREGDAVV